MLTTPHHVLAVFEQKQATSPTNIKDAITLVLDGIQDPGNLGTIIRTADWFGVNNIICSPVCADMYNPKVVQSTMGSIARVNIFYTDLTAWLQKNNTVKKYAAALHGENINNLKDIKEAILIIGSEGKGISEAVMNLVDEKITIPKIGEAESLNAAVAAGIILSKIC
jgi:TrmH family RNA methyltransferase